MLSSFVLSSSGLSRALIMSSFTPLYLLFECSVVSSFPSRVSMTSRNARQMRQTSCDGPSAAPLASRRHGRPPLAVRSVPVVSHWCSGPVCVLIVPCFSSVISIIAFIASITSHPSPLPSVTQTGQFVQTVVSAVHVPCSRDPMADGRRQTVER